MSYANQVAVITGASSGIGMELARQLAAEGCKVGLIARRQHVLDEFAEKIRADGGTAEVYAADVGNRGQTHLAIQSLTDRLGPVDLLIANAGVGVSTPLEPLGVAIDEVERMVRVNFLGVIYSIEAVLPAMLSRKSGHLAGVSSLAGFKGLPGESGYCATKAAVNAYLEGLRVQLRGTGVAVTTVCPGFVETPMIAHFEYKMPGLMSAEYAGRRIIGALRRKPAVFRFPARTSLLMRAARWTPDWLLAHFMNKYNIKPAPPAPVP